MVAFCLSLIVVFHLVDLLGIPWIASAGANRVAATTHHFGLVSAGQEVRHAFTIRNKGRETLCIRNAVSSCPCVQVLSYPLEIDPGEVGVLDLRWTPTESGKAIHEILCETQNSPASPLRFVLTGMVRGEIPPLRADPHRAEIPAVWVTRVVRRSNPALFISVESLFRKPLRNDGTCLVDVRPLKDYERCRIPGSIQIPLFALASREYLKPSHLVLIGHGYDSGKLERACARLIASGFRATVLEGGIAAWVRKGQPLEGNVMAEERFIAVPPGDFFEERHWGYWIFINTCVKEKAEGDRLIPQAFSLPQSDEPGEFVSRVQELLKSQEERNPRFVLIFDDNGDAFPGLARMLRQRGVGNIFFLEGGVAGYRKFMEHQLQVNGSASRGKQGGMRQCASCTKEE